MRQGASGWAGRSLRRSLVVVALGLMGVVVMVALAPLGRFPFRGGETADVAMATTRDRTTLLASDGQRYRDVEMPMPILRALLKAAQGASSGVPAREVEPFLPEGAAGSGTMRILFDPPVGFRMQDDPERTRLPVRLYIFSDGGRTYFLTLRP